MKLLIQQEGRELATRARKDEQPNPGSRAWKEVPLLFEEKEKTGLIAEGGHWIYFEDNGQWYKLDAVELTLTELVVIKRIPRVVKSEAEKQEARKARRQARKEKRKAAKGTSETKNHEDEQEEELARHLKRKAKAHAQDPDS